MWIGHYLNEPGRRILRDSERISRPLLHGKHGFGKSPCDEASERIKTFFRILVSAPLALGATPVSFIAFSWATFAANHRLEVIDEKSKFVSPTKRNFTMLSLNGCLQECFGGPIGGGVVTPFAPAGKHASRVAALAHWVGAQNAEIFLGQEFTDLYAQDAFVAVMQKYGYRHFIIDRAPHPFFLNSGLLIASKYRLQNPSFISMPILSRWGCDWFVQKGALSVEVVTKTKLLFKVINTHLNAETNHRSTLTRHHQLSTYIMPHFSAENAPATILGGDFNFDTSDPAAKAATGLTPYTNIFEGHTTWTSEGINHLRGTSSPIETQSVDVMISNSPRLTLTNPKVTKAEKEEGILLTDHYAISAAVRISL
jgi:endonuclease/exonuclease/phosphatase family metal-dependent hydrolase